MTDQIAKMIMPDGTAYYGVMNNKIQRHDFKNINVVFTCDTLEAEISFEVPEF